MSSDRFGSIFVISFNAILLPQHPVSSTYNFLHKVYFMQEITLAEVHEKRSVSKVFVYQGQKKIFTYKKIAIKYFLKSFEDYKIAKKRRRFNDSLSPSSSQNISVFVSCSLSILKRTVGFQKSCNVKTV